MTSSHRRRLPEVDRHRRRLPAILLTAVVAGSLAVGGAVSAQGHGWVGGANSDLVARAALTSNTGLGAVEYEPQSLEGPTGFPAAGPADGHIASAGNSRFGELDEQSSTRWVKNVISPGPHAFGWTYTAAHPAEEWRYYITKNGWNQNEPLKRDALQLLQVVAHNGTPADTNPVHTITIPADHSGYHVILAVWEIADTANAFYNVIDVNITGSQSTDVTPPSVPGGLATTSVATTSVALRWSASTDASGISAYRVFRDGVQVGSTASLAYTDTGLTASTAYRYSVRAVDTAGNVSNASAELAVTTTAPSGQDTVAPTAPTGVHSMTTTSSSVDLMWTASTDNTGVVAYRVQRATGTGAFAQVASVTGTGYLNTGLAASTAYRYRVVAVDAAGNVSAASAVFSVTTPAAPGGPTVPTWNPSGAYTKGDVVQYNGVQVHGRRDPPGQRRPGLDHRDVTLEAGGLTGCRRLGPGRIRSVPAPSRAPASHATGAADAILAPH